MIFTEYYNNNKLRILRDWLCYVYMYMCNHQFSFIIAGYTGECSQRTNPQSCSLRPRVVDKGALSMGWVSGCNMEFLIVDRSE